MRHFLPRVELCHDQDRLAFVWKMSAICKRQRWMTDSISDGVLEMFDK
jgi:hypothetical protein